MNDTQKINVVAFSGGKDSTAMLLMMIEKGVPIDKIIFVNTTKEFPQTYEHIEKIKAYIKPLEITTVPVNFDYWLGEHIKTKGKNKGKVGYGFPDFKTRWCSSLKRDTARKAMPPNAIEYHGIAFDEKSRTSKNNKCGRTIRYPLMEWGITQKDALEYCYSKGFNWGGLYEKFSRTSCWCCPMKRISELKTLYTDYPDLWNTLKDMQKKSYRKFRSGYTVSELEAKFAKDLTR